jgi:hypothetical protein
VTRTGDAAMPGLHHVTTIAGKALRNLALEAMA